MTFPMMVYIKRPENAEIIQRKSKWNKKTELEKPRKTSRIYPSTNRIWNRNQKPGRIAECTCNYINNGPMAKLYKYMSHRNILLTNWPISTIEYFRLQKGHRMSERHLFRLIYHPVHQKTVIQSKMLFAHLFQWNNNQTEIPFANKGANLSYMLMMMMMMRMIIYYKLS